MLADLLSTFTDRREALALFEQVRHRAPHKTAWPLLPILTFLAPGGSGKSLLIERLIAGYCMRTDDEKVVVPYAHIDFSQPAQPCDLLSILVEIRNQLQSHADDQRRHLTFPRFDLGASIALASPLESSLPDMQRDDIRKSLRTASSAFRELSEMGQALGNIIPLIPPVLVALKWVRQATQKIPGLDEVLGQIEHHPAWRWYATAQADIGLERKNAQPGDVLTRLHALSTSTRAQKEGRRHLLNIVLPAAFLADLLEALDGSQRPHTWQASTPIILFLDGFEELIDSPEAVGIHLLEVLTLGAHRRQGGTDPLLLVLGSRKRILEHLQDSTQIQAHIPDWTQQTLIQDQPTTMEWAAEYLARWRNQLPRTTRYLRLNHLYLPLWLQDFGPEDTQAYLAKMSAQEQTDLFQDTRLEEVIHKATHGHPLYLALAAAAVIEAQANGQPLTTQVFDEAPVPAAWEMEVIQGQQDRPLGGFLLDLFLRHLSSAEQRELIFLAVPRAFDADILRVLLDRESDTTAREHLARYQHFTFLTQRATDSKLVLHPIVRALLLRRLLPNKSENSDYYRLHSCLRRYFSQHAEQGEQLAAIETAYHALALGDPAEAIKLGIAGQQQNLALWQALMEVVAEAPIPNPSETILQAAYQALSQAEQYHSGEAAVTAVILYWWLSGNEQSNPAWAATQNNLGLAYSNLPGGDRDANLRAAISCYERALHVHTREAFPVDWAMTQNNLGNAYSNLPGGDRDANLHTAISCYKQALHVLTREAFPAEWATTQNNLGAAYSDLPGGDRDANLHAAIFCYEQALLVYTCEAFPAEWAATQNNLGVAYSDLPGADREANLRAAISCYEQSLLVRTREAFPAEWAGTQNNLGNVYSDLPGADRHANLRAAISCYEQALPVFESLRIDYYTQVVERNLGTARDMLQDL
jgi:hypothetical protein